MRLHAVEFTNFMLLRSVKKVFSDKDIIGIIAEYAADPNRSNKGGKTTFIEAILYNLFGASRAEKEVELIHRGADEMMTKTVWLDDDDKKIVIKRGRDIKNNGVLEIKGVDKKREAQEEINSIIGYDKEEFLLTNFFKQSDINQFMDLKPTEKKKHFMKWLKNTHWTRLERAVLDDLKDVNKEIVRCEERVNTLREMAIDQHDIKEEIAELKLDLSDLKEQKVTLEMSVRKLSAGEAAKKELRERSQKITSKISKVRYSIKEKQSYLEEQTDGRVELRNIEEELKEFERVSATDRDKLADERATANALLDDLNDRVENATDNMTGTCPILGETCDRITPDCQTLKSWKQGAKKQRIKVKNMTQQITDILEVERLETRHKDTEQEIALAKSRAEGLKPLKVEYRTLREELSGIESKLSTSKRTKLVEAEDALDAVQRKIKQLTEKAGSLKGALENNAQLQKQIEANREELVALKGRVSELNYIAFMFGKNGIPSQEIENAFDEIEDDVNFILERLGTNFQLDFSPDRELGTWEDNCVQCGWSYPKGTRKKECGECGADRQHKRKDELQLRILEDGVDEGFYMESGGGKSLVSIAVRIALTRLKQRQNDSKFPVLFLDEPDSAFDAYNKKAFINLITKTLIRDFGFEQIFWITHDRQIQESVPHVLKMLRYENHSKAVWV